MARADEGLLERLGQLSLPLAVEQREIGGVPTYVMSAPDVAATTDTPIYLDIHGGGLIMGGGECLPAHGRRERHGTGMIVWAPDYRMPPRHPYPAPLDDCMAVYRALLEERPPEDIFVGGGSAGGNLAAGVVSGRRTRDCRRRPRCPGLARGGPDRVRGLLPGQPRARQRAGRQPHADEPALRERPRPHRPLPFAALRRRGRFPSTFVQAGTRDLFLSNAVRMHRKLRTAGVDAELHVFEAMPHGGFAGAPEDIEVRVELRRFLDKHRLR